LFIINEHEIIANMARPAQAADLDLYRPAFDKWMPKAQIRQPAKPLERFDGVVAWRIAGKTIRYLVEVKRHFRHQDAAVIAEQLNRRRAELTGDHRGDRLLLLAPHVRAQQAAVLERAGIDYLDLAGNVHLTVPGHFVHVEGRQPPRERVTAPTRPQKGWIKAVMAILLRPELVNAPFRHVAEAADVALGTVAKCMHDLTVRGLLRDQQGERTIADRQALVALWVQAYIDALRPGLKERRFQVRADDKPQLWARLQAVLAEQDQRWALTGADAAARRDGFFRAEDTEIYAPVGVLDDREVQKALVAQPAVREGNLLVIEPPGPLAIPDATDETVPAAPDLLAYAELRYRGTGQATEAAELLLPRVLGDATD
jgi:hypothetical protein